MDRKRILIVDDEPETRAGLCLAIELHGHEAIIAGNGKDALRTIADLYNRGKTVDLMICDIQMPHMNGEELIDMMSILQFDIPFLMITGLLHEDVAERLLHKGCRGILDKPFSLERLIGKIESILLEKEPRPIDDNKTEQLPEKTFHVSQTSLDISNRTGAIREYANILNADVPEESPAKDYMAKLLSSGLRSQ